MTDADLWSVTMTERAGCAGSAPLADGATQNHPPAHQPVAHGRKAGVSASRLYWEYKGGFWDAKGVSIPVAVSVFPGEAYQAPRSWTERAYPKLIHYNKVDKGGHFAAWEQPLLFSEEVRAGFRSLRK
jgi:pimeloyl-ACP methyl ester carboxylesterase